MNMQVVNVTHPNSTRNSCLIAVFKAGDSPANLHTTLYQYREHTEELQGMKWRFVASPIILLHQIWTVRLFTGDFHCTMYTLIGAPGRSKQNMFYCPVSKVVTVVCSTQCQAKNIFVVGVNRKDKKHEIYFTTDSHYSQHIFVAQFHSTAS